MGQEQNAGGLLCRIEFTGELELDKNTEGGRVRSFNLQFSGQRREGGEERGQRGESRFWALQGPASTPDSLSGGVVLDRGRVTKERKDKG